ncbi:TSUP family transporter [Solwaraspora sp. WMMD1047]|uniref:sulfite exporter TauE/SafE family protein n=1 Tax=Solwaraspora sp. WMMD1047 TaxID=3016102 RepID=UPI0024168FE4|nr:TSUP family transporter [Solwaraspora sp. WMMD1047]MDG4831998.1 TSUP family transporter [Solwaraspora sp. WMMD1047]
MRKLLVLALVGLAAQLVDGALGMGYGVTSTTLLLLAAVSPATASASVHLAEIGTTLASGVAHWRFGNVDWAVVRRIALPGALGAFAGATFLSSISTDLAAPWMAGILFALGCYLLIRFSRPVRARARRPLRGRFLAPLGLVAGFVDATGGGGWGPVATPTLLVSGRMAPRKVIGSVDASEFVVSAAASVGFLIGLGAGGFLLPMVAALLAGGLVAAPIAAWLVRIVPAQLLGAAVGGLIVLTNARTLMNGLDLVPAGDRSTVYLVIVAGWLTATAFAVRALRHSRRAAAATAVPSGVVPPGAELPGAELPGAELPSAGLPGAELQDGGRPGAELQEDARRPGAGQPAAASDSAGGPTVTWPVN